MMKMKNRYILAQWNTEIVRLYKGNFNNKCEQTSYLLVRMSQSASVYMQKCERRSQGNKSK